MNHLRIVLGDLNSLLHAAGQESPRLPALELLLSRGERLTVPTLPEAFLAPWQRLLLFELGLAADQRHASAPLEWLGCGGAWIPGTWMSAKFVHLLVGQRGASMREVADLDAADGVALIVALNEVLRPVGFELHEVSPPDAAARLFLHTDQKLDLHFATADGIAEDARDLFPHGRDAPLVRRLMTEVQMVLHEHGINQARERRQLPVVNALALSGAGYVDGPASEQIPSLAGDDPYVQGLARLHGISARSLSAALQPSLEATGAVVAVPVAGGDLQSLMAFERSWARPLVEALRGRSLRVLDLLTLDARFRVTASDLRKFWRRVRPLARLPRGHSGQH